MTKQLIIGLSTIAVAGAALLTTGMYAANMKSTETNTTKMFHMNSPKGENLINTLSGKISAPALQELETLMKKHKTEMDTLMAKGTPVDKTAMEAQHALFKTEMDTLMVKYPEIKTAMPQKGSHQGKGGKNDEIQKIMSTLPESVQTEIKNIRTSYEKKGEALRNEEKTQIDTILAAYPEIKNKLDIARSQIGKHMMGSQRGNR
ncbi:hypothetical protein K2X92_05520 [Candidatus Gracilibacteria bacterium]|nr:hypothetical protein [Candidatus Gracilibacteria bacterium]